jgi:hypothetical protein
MYVTVITDEDRNRANERLNAYLEQYYGQPAAAMRSRQACYAGPNGGLAEWLQGYARAGAACVASATAKPVALPPGRCLPTKSWRGLVITVQEFLTMRPAPGRPHRRAIAWA